jgi:hypothetical protein
MWLPFVMLFSASGFAQALVSVTQSGYAMVDRGGVSRTAEGSASNVAVGYARIQPHPGNTTPAGVAILGFKMNGMLVSEVGVPATPLTQLGRIYAEVSGPVNTGLAIANPNDQAATLSFAFTDSAGSDFGAGTTVIPANGQIARFLNQEPFNGGNNIRGTFSFSSSAPVSVIALRGFTNERNEFLMSTLPVFETLQAAAGALMLPHFAAGAGWTTQVILVNATDAATSGNIRFVASSGEPLHAFPFSIPRRSAFRLVTPGTTPAVQSGSIRIEPNSGDPAPNAVAIFSYKPAAVTVSEAAVTFTSGSSLRMYVEASVSTESGLAIANLSSSPATVTFELFGMEGSPLAMASLPIPGNGQIAEFLSRIFSGQTLSVPLQGILRITTSGSGISAVGLRGRHNERADFLITTTPVTNESVPANSAELVFPEVVNGGGYSTQFLLYSGSAAQAARGNLRFVNPVGTPMTLNWRSYSPAAVPPLTIIRRVEPVYTEDARQARIQGTLVMQAVIHEDGSLSITGFSRTLGYGLDESAQLALEQWRFGPSMLGGFPVAVFLNIEVNFNLR